MSHYVETFSEVCDTTFNLAKLSLGISSGGIVDDSTRTILASVLQIKGLFDSNLATKFIVFYVNRVSVFLDVKTSVTIQIKLVKNDLAHPFCVNRHINIRSNASISFNRSDMDQKTFSLNLPHGHLVTENKSSHCNFDN